MKCPRCQHENPPQAKFCLECGARVALSCTKCRELPAGAKFCLECGEPVASQVTVKARFTSPESYTPKHLAEKVLTSKSALEGERKQVTVLFADLKGSMELLADSDPEEARKLLDPVDAEVSWRAAIAQATELGTRALLPHCYLGLGKLSKRVGKREEAQEHLTTATTMYREMDMPHWLDQAEAEMRELA